MKLPRKWQWLAYALAPTVLVLVVALQRYSVYVHDQTPWAGGGFGMFSTVDVSGARLLRTYVVTDRGEALIVEPRMGVPALLAYTQPKAPRLDAAARHLARQRWRVYEASDYPAIWHRLPEELRQHLLRSSAWQGAQLDSSKLADVYPPRLAFDARIPMEPGRGVEAEVREVRVEVWKPAFSAGANELTWSLIGKAVASVPSP